jgi:iron complex transport system ATP-binding protein
MVILEFKNISSGYGGVEVLHNINFKLEKGKFMGVIGPNGSGKSTLLKTAAKIIRQYKGSVLFMGRDIRSISFREIAKNISFLPSDIEIAYPYTVRELLLMARYPFASQVADFSQIDFEIVNSIVSEMKLSQLLDRTIFQLSQGEKQRVLLAQCLVQNPALVILDEPTAHLDIGHQFAFLDMLKEYQNRSSLSILAVLHDLNLASQYCDHLLLLNNGSIEVTGTPDMVLRYEILEKVYHTSVLVYTHPISGKPYVFGVPDEWKKLTKRKT